MRVIGPGGSSLTWRLGLVVSAVYLSGNVLAKAGTVLADEALQ